MLRTLALASTPIDLYGAGYVDCAGGCLNDLDGDGICNEDEVLDSLRVVPLKSHVATNDGAADRQLCMLFSGTALESSF